MPSIINLKFKGNKSFVAFSNLNDNEALTKTWKVCTKVASYLEQGQRLENLSWRLWHLQSLMVDADNARSKREFKKLSKVMGDKLDKEKGRSIEELEAPDYKRNSSTDMIQQRALEKERNREASLHGGLKRLQYTFSVDHPIEAAPDASVRKPDLKPSPEFMQRGKGHARACATEPDDNMLVDQSKQQHHSASQPQQQQQQKLSSSSSSASSPSSASAPNHKSQQYLHFPSLFSDSFGPAAMLFTHPTRSSGMNYGEGINSLGDGFGVSRPTIELPLDDFITTADSPESSASWNLQYPSMNDYEPANDSSSISHPPPGLSINQHHLSHHSISSSHQHQFQHQPQSPQQQQIQQLQPHHPPQPEPSVTTVHPISLVAPRHFTNISTSNDSDLDDSNDSDDADSDYQVRRRTYAPARPTGKARNARNRGIGRSNTPTNRPHLTVKTNSSANRPGATATNLAASTRVNNPHNNTAPGGAKAECQNCGATHTPLWRRGLNDELNCNACGLYCKLHKRPRPKTMRNAHGEGRTQSTPRAETVDVMEAQCYNCHTTATPLWRKDDEGKTVCNACGLYFKLHGSARPISMKSDVIRKRSRHDARRSSNQGNTEETPSASPGVSRRASPVSAEQEPPTFVPDSTTQMQSYDTAEYQSTQSELMGALGQYSHFQFPGPLHPDYITNHYPTPQDALPFASSMDSSDAELSNSNGSQHATSPRVSKRRRMSTDSASEPPSSAVSYSSYNSGYSSTTSSVTSHSQRSSMDFSFATFPTFGNGAPGGLRGPNNTTFWHPPLMPSQQDSPPMYHPPMLPPASDDSPMDYLHPPMLLPQEDEALFSSFIHPPMSLPSDDNLHNSHPPMWPSDYDFDSSMRVGF